MNKVVCNICGTSYPENATQCPICGYVRTAEQGLDSQDRTDGSYTYVKGGRFSKANVRKRTQASQSTETLTEAEDVLAGKPKKASRTGAIIAIIVLLLAIILVGGFIVLRFFVPNDFLYVGLDDFKVPAIQNIINQHEEEPENTTATVDDQAIPCSSIILSHTEAELDPVDGILQLTITLDPADTTDTLQFSSDNASVAIVDANGKITAIGEGSTVIRVVCGQMSAECAITCVSATTESTEAAPTETLMLNRKEITFYAEGESWILYDGSIAVSAITWSSDNEAVATISDGKVIAIANGDTTVYGVYEDQTVSCIIHCNFDGEGNVEGNSGITEAGSDAKRTYRLYNPYGNAEDVTLQVNESFTLILVDENDAEITGANWSVSDESICSYDSSVVTGLASGYAEISATYEGTTYTCIIRVP